MNKRTLDIAIVLTVFLAMGGTAQATQILPDTCTTSLLLTGVIAGLGLVRKFVRLRTALEN
jgi:PIN domain nuclease of toxin-antitoxin system